MRLKGLYEEKVGATFCGFLRIALKKDLDKSLKSFIIMCTWAGHA